MEAAWRLVWALPLVVATGAAVVLFLRRIIAPVGRSQFAAQRLRVRETISLSEHSRAHLIEVDDRAYLLVESSQTMHLQPVAALATETSVAVANVSVPWLRRLYRAAAR